MQNTLKTFSFLITNIKLKIMKKFIRLSILKSIVVLIALSFLSEISLGEEHVVKIYPDNNKSGSYFKGISKN